ncbi:hypothetical protein ANCCAN_23593 [Ancylostoma caninum]|uniref:ET module n=1 Tax=Ancylostoma caninum TaxID=29170 RepID=A0A368FEM8_ANCCA|nr:hypothetical protein ANCCAN_23593 [Ancylostoma caninum]
MAFLRFVTLFAVLIATAYSLQCYSQQTNGVDKPTAKIDCTSLNSKYCIKNYVSANGVSSASYGCAPAASCSASGCTSPIKGATVCCCNSDLCNSSSMFSMLPAMVPLAVMKLIGF